MAIVFEKTKVKGGFPIFWRGEFAVLPGDFKLKGTYPEGTKITKGTPIKLDFDNMECSICKSARVLSGGTTTAPHVKKGSMLQVGDAVKVGESNSTVKSIDTKNADYDVITFAAAVTGATEGVDVLSDDNLPDAVVETDMVYSANNGFQTVSAGYAGIILKDVAYPVPAAWLQGYSLKNNPEIKYVRQ